MTDFWESEYKHSFKWPKILGSSPKRDAENQVQVPVVNESIQTADASHIEEIDLINLPSEDYKSESLKPDNAPEIKKAFYPISKSKDVKKKKPLSDGIRDKKPPEMLSYGWGNNHPSVPGNFMKTFNVKVPSDEVYSSTRERLQRVDKNATKKKPVQVIPQPETVIKDALQQYLEAKKRLEKLQTIYKSEYQMEYLNWAEPLQQITNSARGAAGLSSDHYDKDKSKNHSPKVTPQIKIVRETESSPSKGSSLKKNQQSPSEKTDKSISPIKSASVNLQTDISQSPFINPHKIYDQLQETESPVKALEKIVPAGVSDAYAFSNRERRHYTEKQSEMQQNLINGDDSFKLAPEDTPKRDNSTENNSTSDGKILLYNVDPPTTWRLAQDLLDRAHKRSQIIDKDS